VKAAQSEKRVLIPVCRLYDNNGIATVLWKIRSKAGGRSPYHDKEGEIKFDDKNELQNISLILSQVPVSGIKIDELLVSLESIDSEGSSQFGKVRNCNFDLEYDLSPATFNFKDLKVKMCQSTGKTDIFIVRTGNISGAANLTLKQRCKTNSFYDKSYQIKFLEGELEQKISVELDPNSATTDYDEIDVDLESVNDEEVVINMTCHMTVENDLKPTIFKFETVVINAFQSDSKATVDVIRSGNMRSLASIKWRILDENHPFELSEGRLAFDEGQRLGKIQIPIIQTMCKKQSFFADLELFDAKGERAIVSENNIAGLVVKLDLTFFELEKDEHNFVQSALTGKLKVLRLNNQTEKAEILYLTSSPSPNSEWNGGENQVIKFEPNSTFSWIDLEFDPSPGTISTEKVTLKLLPNIPNNQS
jgi:hypothetical protein